MNAEIVSTKLVKPLRDDVAGCDEVPLSIFDNVNYDIRVGIIWGIRAPAPTSSSLEHGLAVVLSKYRDCAGRLGSDAHGRPALLLKDGGVKLVEAVVDERLDESLLSEPSSALLSLHPSLDDNEHLVQIQLTRFKCGTLVMGLTAHHYAGDGPSFGNFLTAWGMATRGLTVDRPQPFLQRTFAPYKDLQTKFEHRGVEFNTAKSSSQEKNDGCHPPHEEAVVSRFHFSKEFIAKLKQKASTDGSRPHSSFVTLQAHIWRAMTKARQQGSKLDDDVSTNVKISVDGRPHLGLPDNYFGNVILWAVPTTTVKSLADNPLGYAASIIHKEVARVNRDYFRSFVNFASSDTVKKENLVSSAFSNEVLFFPNSHVDSWVKMPVHLMDFGTGNPFAFLPTYYPLDGLLFLLPSLDGHGGGVDAIISMFEKDMGVFRDICYDLCDNALTRRSRL